MFGTSGIRGPVGETVTARLALDVGRAVAVDADKVVLGRDVRVTGSVLADAVSAGARECGADVVRLGVVSTPTLARSVEHYDATAGIGITASHNPAPDNGIKLWNPSGQAFTPSQTDEISARLESPDMVESAPWDAFGTERSVVDSSSRHVNVLTEAFRARSGSEEPLSDLSVVVDLGNGTGRVSVDAMYDLGATVHTLDGQHDGRFPARKSEPNADTLGALQSTVPALGADLGIAHDGDADRMVAVSGDGAYVSGDVLLALFAREAVSNEGFETDLDVPDDPRVAVPVDTSLVVADTVAEYGGDVEYTPVGDVHVAAAASRENFVFGGEPSGAWIWPEQTLAPDGHFAAVRLAALVQERGSLDSLVGSIPTEAYVTRRENIPVTDPAASMNAIESELRDRYDGIDTIDGLRVDTDDGWFLVRPSGTEPLIRVTAEARDEALADELNESALEIVSGNAT